MKGIEAGAKFPSLENLKKLCNILATTADILLTGDEREPLSLKELSEEQITIVRDLYTKLKEESNED